MTGMRGRGRIIRADGTPFDGEYFNYDEALEQCYGMIWFLANDIAGETLSNETTREDLLRIIAYAQKNYRKGVDLRDQAESPDRQNAALHGTRD